MNFEKIQIKVNKFHIASKTIDCAQWLLKKFELQNDNLKGFEIREIAQPDFILMTTEGNFGQPQIIKIPENTFQFPLSLMLNLLAHEMVHVRQKTIDPFVLDKNEREWQAYYEMLFHEIFPKIPENSPFHQQFFAKKALKYYSKMGDGSELQLKYVNQKIEVEKLIENP